MLGVDSLDELEIVVGLAAYISLAERVSAPHLPAGVEAIAEAVSRGIGHGWARRQDLARRLPFGGGAEPSATAAPRQRRTGGRRLRHGRAGLPGELRGRPLASAG